MNRFSSFAGLAMLLLPLAARAADAPYRVVWHIPGSAGTWGEASMTPETRQLLVARSDGVTAVDLDLGSINGSFAAGADVRDVIPVGDTRLLAASNGGTKTVTLLNDRTGAVAATITPGGDPGHLVFEPKTALLLAMTAQGTAVLIDPAKRTAVGSIALGGKPTAAAADGDGLVYVDLADKEVVAVIDVAARSVAKTLPLPGCREPTGLAYDAQSRLLIASCSNAIAKIVTADGADTASLPVGKNPDAVMLDGVRRRAFVAAADGTLAVISIEDPAKISVVQRVTTEPGARTGALDPTSGRMFLPAGQAGSFEILVVGTS